MLPNLIIIGAMKAGTTSLHNYLDFHPDISMSSVKETNFFSSEDLWRRGSPWYQRHFDPSAKVRGESSTSYSAFPMRPGVPKRMHSLVPDAKLVYVVRNPVDRMISHYVHARSDGSESRPFSAVIEDACSGVSSDYVCQSRYFFQLSRFLEYYDRAQILIITTEELKNHREEALREICRFLGLSYHIQSFSLEKLWNKGEEQFLFRGWRRFCFPRWMQTHPTIPWRLKAPFRFAATLGSSSIERPKTTAEERRALQAVFQEDIHRLQLWSRKDLSTWLLQGGPPVPLNERDSAPVI